MIESLKFLAAQVDVLLISFHIHVEPLVTFAESVILTNDALLFIHRPGYMKGRNLFSFLSSFRASSFSRFAKLIKSYLITFYFVVFKLLGIWDLIISMILQGGLADGYKSYLAEKEIPDETYKEDGTALFRIQGTGPDNMQAIQVEVVCCTFICFF